MMNDFTNLWSYYAILPLGGIECIGFDHETDLLLVCSSAGRGIIDCSYPKVIARENIPYYPDQFKAKGIGQLNNKIINVVGLNYTNSLYKPSPILNITENWEILVDARSSIFLKPRNADALVKALCIAKNDDLTSLVGCCISNSEKYIVIAYQGELIIYAKAESFRNSNIYKLQNAENKYSRVKYKKF